MNIRKLSLHSYTVNEFVYFMHATNVNAMLLKCVMF